MEELAFLSSLFNCFLSLFKIKSCYSLSISWVFLFLCFCSCYFHLSWLLAGSLSSTDPIYMQTSLYCPLIAGRQLSPNVLKWELGRTHFLLDMVLLVCHLVKIKKLVTSFSVCMYALYAEDWLCFQVYKTYAYFVCLFVYMCVYSCPSVLVPDSPRLFAALLITTCITLHTLSLGYF